MAVLVYVSFFSMPVIVFYTGSNLMPVLAYGLTYFMSVNIYLCLIPRRFLFMLVMISCRFLTLR